MAKNENTPDRMVYWGNCSNPECSAIMTISPHPETPDDVVKQIAEGPDVWENSFADCPVCYSRIEWGGSDPLPFTLKD